MRRPVASHVPGPPTAPFAAGREADVYALDDGRILRRYRTGADATGEAQVMAYVGRFGYPVPEVFAVDGADLVMARVDGSTMSEAPVAGKLAVGEGASMLADLLRRPFRSGQLNTLSADEIGALGAAAARVRGDR